LSSRYIAGIYDNLRRGRGVPTARSRGQHLFVADALDDPTFAGVADLVRAEGFRSFLSLPIMLEHRHLGNLNLYFDEVISYDPDLVAKGQELADVVAAHLDRVSG
jgi:GAF domain-containing protein